MKCAVCGKEFEFQHAHEMVTHTKGGVPLNVPHCRICCWDNGKCPDDHGCQCDECYRRFPMFNI